MIIVKLRDVLQEYQRRTGHRLTRAELAELAGLGRATVESLSSRKSYNTTLETIDKICAALGCQLTDLLERVEDESEAQPDPELE